MVSRLTRLFWLQKTVVNVQFSRGCGAWFLTLPVRAKCANAAEVQLAERVQWIETTVARQLRKLLPRTHNPLSST